MRIDDPIALDWFPVQIDQDEACPDGVRLTYQILLLSYLGFSVPTSRQRIIQYPRASSDRPVARMALTRTTACMIFGTV